MSKKNNTSSLRGTAEMKTYESLQAFLTYALNFFNELLKMFLNFISYTTENVSPAK
jgi:hypothetical protein